MQFPTRRRAIIIGGGIGGITTALALRRVGLDVAVFERTKELREVGSGLPLWSNALRAFNTLGLTNIVESLGQPVTRGSVTNWCGDMLLDVSTEELLKKSETMNIVVHRAELLSALLNALGTENVSLGMTCVGCTQDETGVSAYFSDGKVARGDLLVGADGLHSIIRSQLFGAAKPRYAGYVCWRGVAHTTRTDIETWAWGKNAQFGITPMSDKRAYWFAQRDAPEGERAKGSGRKREILDLFGGWHDPIPEIIEATEETSLLCHNVYESPLLSHWSRGRVTLLGDAAHTMPPNLGQGAWLAIEDAVVLADCLKTETDVVAGLRLYEKRRVTRANTIARLAGLIGNAVQLENPLVSTLRNAVIKKIPSSVPLQHLMWILDYQV